MSERRGPFAVRAQTSGWNGISKYIVVMNPGGRRVSVHAHITRSSAQASSDALNIADLVKPHAEDPRPYAVRLAEAEVAYREKYPA
ncbi:MAG: hypothetical protein ACREQ5_01070 [Candidatus Dormibacteria bacterium]